MSLLHIAILSQLTTSRQLECVCHCVALQCQVCHTNNARQRSITQLSTSWAEPVDRCCWCCGVAGSWTPHSCLVVFCFGLIISPLSFADLGPWALTGVIEWACWSECKCPRLDAALYICCRFYRMYSSSLWGGLLIFGWGCVSSFAICEASLQLEWSSDPHTHLTAQPLSLALLTACVYNLCSSSFLCFHFFFLGFLLLPTLFRI